MREELIEERRKKLNNLRQAGIDPYPAEVKRTLSLGEAVKKFESLKRSRKKIFLTGRIRGFRNQGGVLFLDIDDGTGALQAVAKKENLKNFNLWKENLDVGDFVEVNGQLFKTKRGEKSIEAKTLRMIVKSLRPIPSNFYGLEDVELRLRKRYLDLLLHPELREMFVKKSKFWETFRKLLKKDGFLEVETPVLETVPGGADAEPFKTHHNALDTDFYLRISLEIALKKLLVGGYSKVFEIGRVFRNEGISAEHLQDYTQLEFYWAYADYEDLMRLIEKLYKEIVKSTCGGLITTWQGKKIDWGKKWPKVDYVEVFKKMNQLDPTAASRQELVEKAKALDLKVKSYYGKGRLTDLIFKKTVRPTFVQPTFLVNHPIEVSPLAKRLSRNPHLVERVQVMACGTEVGNGWSELNDPLDQRVRFEEQMRLREAGDKEAQRLDEEFLEALEYGVPPTTGFGVSERLFAVLMDKPIRETVFFPLMKRK